MENFYLFVINPKLNGMFDEVLGNSLKIPIPAFELD